MTPPRGRFITLEGGEGSGKSTQARLLAEALSRRGLDVVRTREPGGSEGAELVRQILLSGAAEPFGTDVEALLFAAARGDHVDQLILPALATGHWVICDRFVDSTRVYQGAVGKVDIRLLRALERVVASAAVPDLTLILDLPPEVGLARAAVRGRGAVADRFEREGIAFHTAVREAFLAIAQTDPVRCKVIDASGEAETVAERVWDEVEGRLGAALSPAGAR
ncbi:dTMP kinase [Aquabacter spiritensis]|uniref:Thymidylate kinase n=1 Tax=Aquabacter spiritensis TaxID=933073 RepID=A0A4R3LQB4_9HYPH|nr:dTMP kinase [Aquabacter spiritensis]TCT02622.1 thymidylate kinase [Aquabacter spiritensis]